MKPLAGVKILDFTQFFSGPLCTLILRDAGAEVIKLENPPLGDNTRYGADVVSKQSTNFTGRNRGKKSVLMNLKDDKQKALFLKMVESADAVVENFKPGTMEKYGLDYETLRKINHKLVYTSISGFGQTGPWRSRAAFDLAVQASSGIMSVTGELDGDPLKVGSSVADYAGGLYGCIGTLIALYSAQKTGVGRRVDVAMNDALIVLLDNYIPRYDLSGIIPKPMGNRHPTAVPFRPFACRNNDQVIVCITTDENWVKFCQMVGKPEWSEDPKYATFTLRKQNRWEIEKMVADVLKDWEAPVLCVEMEKRGLVYSQINNVKQVVEHPQTAARNMVVAARFPNGPEFRVPGNPVKISSMEDLTEFTASPLGYNTIEVMSEYADPKTVHEIYDKVLQESAAAVEKMFEIKDLRKPDL